MELEGQAAGARLGLRTGGPRLEDMQETFQIIVPWRWRSELRKGLRGEGQCDSITLKCFQQVLEALMILVEVSRSFLNVSEGAHAINEYPSL